MTEEKATEKPVMVEKGMKGASRGDVEAKYARALLAN